MSSSRPTTIPTTPGVHTRQIAKAIAHQNTNTKVGTSTLTNKQGQACFYVFEHTYMLAQTSVVH